MSIRRARPLVLVATPNASFAEKLVMEVEDTGSIACVARSAEGCLRVATSVGPDVVLLDAALPDRLRPMLRSHPATAASIIVRVFEGERNVRGAGPLRDVAQLEDWRQLARGQVASRRTSSNSSPSASMRASTPYSAA